MTDNALRPLITLAGMRAVTTAYEQATQIDISHIAVGDGNGDGYAPDVAQTELIHETQRVAILSRNMVTDKHVRMLTTLDGDSQFFIRELGVFLADGTLFAIWSDDALALGEKTGLVPFDLSFDLVLDQIPAEVINVVVTQPDFNLQMIGEIAALSTSIAHLNIREIGARGRIEAAGKAISQLEGRRGRVAVDIEHLRGLIDGLKTALADQNSDQTAVTAALAAAQANAASREMSNIMPIN